LALSHRLALAIRLTLSRLPHRLALSWLSLSHRLALSRFACFAGHRLTRWLASFSHGDFTHGHGFGETRSGFETFTDTFVGDFLLARNLGGTDAGSALSFCEVLRGSL
jgi:hypothetical protein